jgi:hypothetical protein
MAALVQVKDSDGVVLFAGDFSEAALTEIAVQDRVDDVVSAATATMQSVASTVRRCAAGLREAFNDLTTDKRAGGSFSTAEVEFGVVITAEGNVVVAKGSVEANLKVNLTWNFE